MSKARILIVEDDPHAAALTDAQVKVAGFGVVGIFASGREAIESARVERPDLVLVDLQLRGELDGIATAQAFSNNLNIPALYLIDSEAVASARIGVPEPFAYVLKPVQQRELVLTVEMALYRHRMEARLKQSERQLAAAQRIGRLGSWSMNFGTERLHWSDETLRLFEMPAEATDIDYATFLSRVHPEDRGLVDAAIQNAVDQGERYSIYHRMIQPDTTARVVHHTGEVELDPRGKARSLTGVLQDVTETKAVEAQLWHMAHHDPLCDLPNRLLMYDRMNDAMARSRRNKQQLALLLFDLDDFRRLNEDYGHEAGDKLLTNIADRLRRCARECDTVARLGGDQFTLIIEQLTDPRDAAVVAQKILDSMQEPVCLDGHNMVVTGSIGLALYPRDADALDGLMKAAGSAMQQSKRSGKNSFHFYTDVKRQTH
ncbi:MAG: diguanylate cyclase [Thiohalobacteraceae bacterium]